MKRSQLLYLIFLSLLAFSSCTRPLYTHQATLKRCRTRDDVLRQIRFPDEKIYTKTTEEWVYNLDSRTDTITKPPVFFIDSLPAVKPVNYAKYLNFTFDLKGNVTGYESNVADPVKAILRRDEHITPIRVFGATLFLALIVYIDVVTKSELSF